MSITPKNGHLHHSYIVSNSCIEEYAPSHQFPLIVADPPWAVSIAGAVPHKKRSVRGGVVFDEAVSDNVVWSGCRLLVALP